MLQILNSTILESHRVLSLLHHANKHHDNHEQACETGMRHQIFKDTNDKLKMAVIDVFEFVMTTFLDQDISEDSYTLPEYPRCFSRKLQLYGIYYSLHMASRIRHRYCHLAKQYRSEDGNTSQFPENCA